MTYLLLDCLERLTEQSFFAFLPLCLVPFFHVFGVVGWVLSWHRYLTDVAEQCDPSLAPGSAWSLRHLTHILFNNLAHKIQ